MYSSEFIDNVGCEIWGENLMSNNHFYHALKCESRIEGYLNAKSPPPGRKRASIQYPTSGDGEDWSYRLRATNHAYFASFSRPGMSSSTVAREIQVSLEFGSAKAIEHWKQ